MRSMSEKKGYMEKHILKKDYDLIEEWWHDNLLAIVRGSGDMSRKALDHWGDCVIAAVRAFPEYAPVFMMFDLSSPKQGFTPYSRSVIDRVYNSLPMNKPLYVGIFMREGIISRIISLYVNRREGRNLTMKMFFDEDKTVKWLRTMMKQHGVLDEEN